MDRTVFSGQISMELFFYDGGNITNLIKGKIPQNIWQQKIGSSDAHHASVAYHEKTNNLYILANNLAISATSDNNGVYTYNFDSKAWVWQDQDAMLQGVDKAFSNFISDGQGGIVFNTIDALSATAVAQGGISETSGGDDVDATHWIMQTKDIDFGDPGQELKKVYGVPDYIINQAPLRLLL